MRLFLEKTVTKLNVDWMTSWPSLRMCRVDRVKTPCSSTYVIKKHICNKEDKMALPQEGKSRRGEMLLGTAEDALLSNLAFIIQAIWDI